MMPSTHDRNCISSDVENTLTADCDFNSLSFDHKEHLCFNANAKYATSSTSGEISFARGKKDRNSMTGTNLICVLRNVTAWWNFTSDNPVFSTISSSCSSISSSKNSGAYSLSASKKNKSAVCPRGEIKAAIKILASMIKSIQNAEGCIFLNLSCMDLFTFLPNSIANSSASFSESLDAATIDLRILNWANFCRMDSRATSDQLISGQLSISNFISCGTAKVKVDIGNTSTSNTLNTLNTLVIFKPYGG